MEKNKYKPRPILNPYYYFDLVHIIQAEDYYITNFKLHHFS